MEQPENNAPSKVGIQGLLQRAGHPVALIFHYAFKISALISYMFLSIFISNTAVTFIITLLCCCADFWVVQNVTGRLLVALRWRNKVNDDGTEQWVFESLNEKHENNRIDSWGFWLGLYGYVLAWGLMVIGSLLTLSPFGIIESVVCMALAGVNLYGYSMCRKDHLQKLQGAFSMGTALGAFKFGAEAKV